ncbi:unnamed protein product [Discula destructiva]
MADPATFANVNTNIEPLHRGIINKIEGVYAHDSVQLPRGTGRLLMVSDTCFSDALPERYVANGSILMQCVIFFGEFFPTRRQIKTAGPDDLASVDAFYTLIRDNCGIFVERLSAQNTMKVHDFWLRIRKDWLNRNERVSGNIPKSCSAEKELFLLLLDDRQWYVDNGYSRAQLRYGSRTNATFALRMATRVVQWREKLKNSQTLRLKPAKIDGDVFAGHLWTPELVEMAKTFATAFKKPAPSLPASTVPTALALPAHSDVEDENEDAENPQDTPKTKMIKTLQGEVAGLQAQSHALQRSQKDGFEQVLNRLSNLNIGEPKEDSSGRLTKRPRHFT